MRYLITLISVFLLVTGAAVAPDAAPRRQVTLLVLGDSLSAGYGITPAEGWVTLLQQRLSRQEYGVGVINASASGETSAGGVARLPHLLETHHPKWVIIELGANDGLRGLPTSELQANLTALVKSAQAAGATVLLVGIHLPTNYGIRYTKAFESTFTQVAAQQNVAITPNLLAAVALEDRNFQADHLHPTSSVQPQLMETIWQQLQPLLKPRYTAPRS